ncbi:kinase-like domain-containing protein [Halteromyces radiatus]|uniref:kinase-like domain-containing protein n=1 Tax=Halteromyces radiatus TaxID=101107 RepID=UPI00221F7657|nr:kinase-like domain-containing protein [Halteromyces radiatus]KAI8097689.1 kinase-like domain-containing protein [Halteromyces radiatus]
MDRINQHMDSLTIDERFSATKSTPSSPEPRSATPRLERSKTRPNLPFPPPRRGPSASISSSSSSSSSRITNINGLPPLPRSPGGLCRSNSQPITSTRRRPKLNLAQMGVSIKQTPFSNLSKYVDPSGKLNFAGKAIIHAEGVDFSNGNSFNIRMDDLVLEKELGHGQYGTVQRVYHKRTKVVMAMKEIRLELDETKLQQILMELDILHKSTSDYIVEFYGAFFIETCVYYCMEYMDAGSLDRLYGDGIPENILAKIAICMVKGLKFLKDELSIIHRDVKPTNVLMNLKGDVKLCDFGVSGQLDKSLAKTNIGCQSYMAPERIKASSKYTVASDVWSLGVSLLEMALGRYPYKFDNMFDQLKAITDGPLPAFPSSFSKEAQDFLSQCLQKDPFKRPSYAELLEHPFILYHQDVQVDMASWVKQVLERKNQNEK